GGGGGITCGSSTIGAGTQYTITIGGGGGAGSYGQTNNSGGGGGPGGQTNISNLSTSAPGGGGGSGGNRDGTQCNGGSNGSISNNISTAVTIWGSTTGGGGFGGYGTVGPTYYTGGNGGNSVIVQISQINYLSQAFSNNPNTSGSWCGGGGGAANISSPTVNNGGVPPSISGQPALSVNVAGGSGDYSYNEPTGNGIAGWTIGSGGGGGACGQSLKSADNYAGDNGAPGYQGIAIIWWQNT
ncbi:MAG: hypothetical protein ORN50_06265, partial [Crocinitomicaceae bacterium]|nr:hypothetical protein [Crocinitomicaceae bacterium]